MKKTLLIFAILLCMLVTLVACENDPDEPEGTTPDAEETTPDETPSTPEETTEDTGGFELGEDTDQGWGDLLDP